ncbi:MAG: protein kinase domain-containing protein [Dokdonella sp.]|uniref:serine/threonine-protein kinase n=1 Tax=Dokdonella sp. TaxID=2291710 RepID=UPI003F7F941D
MLERALAEAADRRDAFLDHACADRPALRERVEHLLHLAACDTGFLDRGAIERSPPDPLASAYAPGQSIAAYRLLRPLGRGGMAEVWLAERSEGGFRQQAALKLIAHAHGALGERFAGERDILAALVHPHIARLHDGGVAADGTAYMVMEYVEGEHLVDYVQAHALTLAERLDLFMQICDAVAYAHMHLVVHRDLKPSNILVTAAGQAMLLDFGIARLIDSHDGPEHTRTVYLSPSYAAPEQLASGAISTATDVYALGVILFEMLTGRRPWAGDEAPMPAAVKRLLDEPLPRPSRIADAGSPVPKRLLRGDLDAIVAKALRREADQRYPDARALADDIRRHRAHQPVLARSGARAYVARRFLRRHWLPLASAAVLFVALALAALAVAWQAGQARAAAKQAEAVQGFMIDLFKTNSSRQKDPVKARQTTARELLEIGAGRIDAGLADAPEAKLALLRTFGSLHEDLALHDQARRFRGQAAALSASIFGGDSHEHVDDLLDLATSMFAAGAFKDVEPVLQDIGSILDRRGDARSVQRGRLLMNAAFAHRSDLTRAHDEAVRAVRILGAFPPSASLAEALYAQGMNEYRMHRADEAVLSLDRAIAMSRATEGVPNANLPTYYYLLASAQRDLLDYTRAEASARQALEVSMAINGEDHADAIRARSMLTLVLAESDRIKEGLSQARQTRLAVQRVLGDKDAVHGMVAMQSCIYAELRAGELDIAAADTDANLAQAHAFAPMVGNLAAALDRAAEVSIETGRTAQALQRLDEAAAERQRLQQPPNGRNALLRIRLALDEDDLDHARSLLDAFAATGAGSAAIVVASLQRDLYRAELELRAGRMDDAVRLAGAASARAGSGDLAPYLRSLAADGDLIEGLARLRGGDATAAQPLLERALATRNDLYPAASPKIAEAQLALAECELARGRRAQAVSYVEQAAAIEAAHTALSARYTTPLQRLRARLARG